LIHGVFDPHVPIGAVRSFCKAYPMHTRLIEVPEGGGLLNYTHMPLILRELTTAEAESDAGAKA